MGIIATVTVNFTKFQSIVLKVKLQIMAMKTYFKKNTSRVFFNNIGVCFKMLKMFHPDEQK